MRTRPNRLPGGLRTALVVLLWAGAAHADDLAIEDLGVQRSMLTVRVLLRHGFDTETRTSIERGLPITVRFTVELWRKRRLWFDKQLDSRVRSFRVRYDPGEKLYSVSGTGRRRGRETFQTLDAALERLSPRDLDVYPRPELEDGPRYYVTVEMAIQPLTVEEFRELDGWLSGRIRGGGQESAPVAGDDGGGVSGAFFGFLLDMAGFGDKIHEAETPAFRTSSLEELPPPR